MKLCFLGDADSIHVRRWVLELVDRGHDIHLISFTDHAIPKVTLHTLPLSSERKQSGRNWRMLLALSKIRRLIAQIEPDLLHSHYLSSYGLLGRLSGFRPHVATAWGSDVLVTPKRSQIARLLLRFTISRCDKVTSDSVFMGEQLLRFGLSKEQLAIVPFGVDIELFSPSFSSTVATQDFKLLSTRTLDSNSNVEVVIRALPEVLKHYPQAQLVIAHDGDQRSQLEAVSVELGVQDSVSFLGKVPHEKLPELLKSASFFFSIPTSDATSVSLLEAMSCGLFPLVSDLPANREWIEDGVNGFILPELDERTLGNRIVSAARDPNLIRSAKSRNRSLIEERANWRTNVGMMEEIYSQITDIGEEPD